jgi:hypothetical protein
MILLLSLIWQKERAERDQRIPYVGLPAWLTSEYYISQSRPRLTQWTRPRIPDALSLSSTAYALKLAELVSAVPGV